MPRTLPQHLKLYTRNVSAPELIAVLAPDAVDRLEHSTRLPGGFHELKLEVASTESDFWDWRHDRLMSRVVLEESSGRTTWEGRVERVALADTWKVAISGLGYWSNLTDTVRNRSYTNGSATGGSIIADLLASIHAETRQVSTSSAHIAAGPSIVHEYQDDWTIWRILTDRRRGVASFGSGAGVQMDVAVWEGRELHYGPRTVSRVTWHSYLRPENGGGVVRLPLRVDWHELANAVVVTYQRSGQIMRTPQAIDADSIARYIRRERHVPNIGESTAATAVQRRDTELNLRKDPRPTAEGLSVNRVWDANGIEWPLCRVRAGDVIRIPDLSPGTADLDRVVFDAYRTFFVEETNCDHETGVLTIHPAVTA